MSRFVAVGTGTVIPEGDRGGSSYWVEEGSGRVLLDCGPGTVQSLARLGLPWDEVSDLCLSHFHPDHVGALPGLLFSLKHGAGPGRSGRPLDVWGPPGTRALFEGLAAALGDFFLDPGFPLEIHEVEPSEEVHLDSGFSLRTAKTPHTAESHALRMEGDAVSLGYTGDTGPDEALEPFFRGVELLVAECSLLDDEVGDNHLSPARVARLARGADPEFLLLTHIYPHVRARHDPAALVRAAGYGGEIALARDGWTHAFRGEGAPAREADRPPG